MSAVQTSQARRTCIARAHSQFDGASKWAEAFLTMVNDALEMRGAAARLAGAAEDELAAVADLLPSELKQAVHAAAAKDTAAVWGR
jgi:hypothetical protein